MENALGTTSREDQRHAQNNYMVETQHKNLGHLSIERNN